MFSETRPRPIPHHPHPHPDPDRIRTAMRRLEASLFRLPSTDDEVDMSVPNVHASPCGTIACHGGRYLLACVTDPEHRAHSFYELFLDTVRPVEGRALPPWRGLNAHPSYQDGGRLLAQDIASDDHPMRTMMALKDWAQAWPDLWGNSHGQRMFNSALAFTEGGGYRQFIKVSEIVAHWLGVADRIEAWKRAHPLTLSMQKIGRIKAAQAGGRDPPEPPRASCGRLSTRAHSHARTHNTRRNGHVLLHVEEESRRHVNAPPKD